MKITKEFHQKVTLIEDIIEEDPVGRGIKYLKAKLSIAPQPTGELEKAALVLSEAKQIFIITGFYIPNAGTIETDGLSGASFLAKALIKLGKEVYVLCDPHNQQILKAGLQEINTFPKLISPDFNSPVKTWLYYKNKAVLVAIERPGRGLKNKYRTMNGQEFLSYPLDELFAVALQAEIEAKNNNKIKTISCADGLNEIGMGKVVAPLAYSERGIIAVDEKIHSIVSVDHLILAGVADWAAYGLIAALSLVNGIDLLPQQDEQRHFLETVIKAGTVDGITKKAELTIDTLPIEIHQAKVEALRKILA